MEFKELPKEIQEIAAHTLRQRLNEVALEAETKKTLIIWLVMCAMRLPDCILFLLRTITFLTNRKRVQTPQILEICRGHCKSQTTGT